MGEAATAAGLDRRAGPAPGTDDWHTDRPAVVAGGGVRAAVKAKMVVRAQRKAELPGQVAQLQQMQKEGRELCEELERRRNPKGGSWWLPEESEQGKEKEAMELQQLTTELEGLELQVATVHPKVVKEVERLQNVERLLQRKLRVQPTVGGSWR